MYKYLFFTLLLFGSNPIFSQNKDQIIGKWLNATGEAHIQIYATSGKYFGKIAWMKTPNDPDGKPRLDKNNPDNNLIWSGREWLPVPGTIDPSSGAFWNGNIWIKKGQVNPQTGLYWDGYNWKEFNKFTGQWQPIRHNRASGILPGPQSYIKKGGDKTLKNMGKYKNNNFTRRK
jgi:hypothetical protein